MDVAQAEKVLLKLPVKLAFSFHGLQLIRRDLS
jgi:hypothetical protein